MTPTPLPSRCAAMPTIAADRDDAGAADAGDNDAVGMIDQQAASAPATPASRRGSAIALAALQLRAVHRDKGRAEPFRQE